MTLRLEDFLIDGAAQTQPQPRVVEPELPLPTADTCQSCGACCREAGEVTVYPTDNTPAYLTRSIRNRMGFASFEADEFRCMKRAEGRCVALRGQLGVRVHCSTYERRPATCRDFPPGSPGCVRARTLMLHRQARADEDPVMLPRGYGPQFALR